MSSLEFHRSYVLKITPISFLTRELDFAKTCHGCYRTNVLYCLIYTHWRDMYKGVDVTEMEFLPPYVLDEVIYEYNNTAYDYYVTPAIRRMFDIVKGAA